jgi:hypothetical protein
LCQACSTIVGGSPFQAYALPIRLDPKVLSGTAAIFFAATNALKRVPYFALGQFDAANLTASAVLMPLAPISTVIGAWLVRRMRPEIFNRSHTRPGWWWWWWWWSSCLGWYRRTDVTMDGFARLTTVSGSALHKAAVAAKGQCGARQYDN